MDARPGKLRSTKDEARLAAYVRSADVDRLLSVLVEASALHLQAQVKAGADCVQIFESWSQDLTKPLFERLVLKPTTALVQRLRALGVTVPIIGFPRGAGRVAEGGAGRDVGWIERSEIHHRTLTGRRAGGFRCALSTLPCRAN